MPAKVIAGITGAALFLTAPALADQWSNILGPVYSSITSSFPNGGAYPVAGVALDYFQCAQPHDTFVTGTAGQCNVIAGFPSNLNISQFASQSEFDAMNNQLSRLDVTLTQKAWSGAALAAALTPMLPTEGNNNHINVGFASMSGYSAVSLNYEHVEHDVDFGVGLATTSKYSLAKVNVGFSW